MKYLPYVLLAGAALVLGYIAWRSPAQSERPKLVSAADGSLQVPLAIVGTIPKGQIVREFAIEGMCCKGCSQKLYDALLAVPEVESAAVNFDAARAYALVPQSFDQARLCQVLTFDKYQATAEP